MLVKICGLCRPHDAAVAADAGATHAGVIRVPGAARWRPPEAARAVLDAAPGVRRVGVFADAGRVAILAEASSLRLDVIQLHGDEPPEAVAALRSAGLEVWKAVKPTGADALLEAAGRYAEADLLLVDGASPRGMGGVGARFDRAALSATRDRLPPDTRLGLAGGLGPDDVGEAIRRFRPALVDVSSGVESRVGEKDEDRVRAFVAHALEAEPDLEPEP
ncbi:MAG TPA: hypothetical protein VMM83_04880 [Longimicrobiales bacterium]|nr:hypothetical protein [Longimicrobiales bacterium]